MKTATCWHDKRYRDSESMYHGENETRANLKIKSL